MPIKTQRKSAMVQELINRNKDIETRCRVLRGYLNNQVKLKEDIESLEAISQKLLAGTEELKSIAQEIDYLTKGAW